MNPKPILAIIITIIIIFSAFYAFSNKLNIKLFNYSTDKDEELKEVRRNIPIDTYFWSHQPLSISFDSKLPKDVQVVINAEQIKVNNQNLKPRNSESSISISNFSGSVVIGNGSVHIKGNGYSTYFGDYEFLGQSSVDIKGKYVNLYLNNIKGDFKLPRITGSFNIISNQSIQKFSVNEDDIEVRNFLGSIDLSRNATETITMKGDAYRIITKDFTISKDY